MIRSEKRLGEILIERGWVGERELQTALSESTEVGKFFGMLLVKKGCITENQLMSALSEQFRIPHVSVKSFYIDWDLVNKFSRTLVCEHSCFPLRREGRTVTLGITNPLDAWALTKAAEEARGQEVKFALVNQSEMEELLMRYRKQVKGNISQLLDQEEE